MTQKDFRKRIVISSVITATVVAVIIGLGIILFNLYPMPDEKNTSVLSGTVNDVYLSKAGVFVEMENGDSLRFVYPWGVQNLFSEIGYDIEKLSDLIEGKVIEYRRTDQWPWILEINTGDVKIDNNKLTAEYIVTTRVGIVIIALIMLAFPISGDAVYIKKIHKVYTRAEKKRERKAKRQKNMIENKNI